MGREHLLTDHPEAIAFGRTRLSALRAAGVRYATQVFDTPWGRVTVRIVGGVEYIEAGGGCVLAMDSGVIDLRSGAPWFAEFALAGLRAPTVITTQHEALMTRHVPGDIGDDSKPPMLTGAGMAGQTLWAGKHPHGTVTLPNAVARSFMPVVVPKDGAWRFSAVDENLINKKLTVMGCPASVFTGRCRDWIQAAYGRFLYTDFRKGSTVISPLALYQQPGAAPALTAAFHEWGRSKEATPPARITTSSGVHRDAEGRHWLFLPGDGDTVDVFQMRSSTCGEWLRRALTADAPAWARQFSAAELDTIETYILAYSLPVQQSWQALQVPGAKYSADAMGYGWHWSRTGLLADRVINSQFKQDSKNPNGQDNWAMRSTHQRLTMGVDGQGRWSATVSVVDGPYDWAVERGLCVVLEPWYGAEGGTWKTTPFYTELFAYSDAAFYVWYRGDDLKKASVSLSRVEETPPVGSCDPPDFEDFSINGAGEMYGWNRGRTVGARGGWAEIVQKVDAHWLYTVTVGGNSFSMRPGRMERGKWFSISAKQEAAPSPVPLPVDWSGTGSWSSGLSRESYAEGYPPWNYVDRPAAPNESIAAYSVSRRIEFSYTKDEFAFTRNYPGRVVVAVPHGDAEAVYVQGTSSRAQHNEAFNRGTLGSGNYALTQTFAFRIGAGETSIGPDRVQYMQGLMHNDSQVGPAVSVPEETITTAEDGISNISTRCPGVQAQDEDWNLSPAVWWADEDVVPNSFHTQTSAMGEVALIGANFGDSVGVALPRPVYGAIVGAT